MTAPAPPKLGALAQSRIAAHSGKLVREVITSFPWPVGFWDDSMITKLRIMVGRWALRVAQEGCEDADRKRTEQPAGSVRGPRDS